MLRADLGGMIWLGIKDGRHFALPPDGQSRKQPFDAVVSVSLQKRANSQKQLSACNQVR